MSEPNVGQLLWNFGASAAGALVAGYVGVWFGLARLKRERGFDHRLAWYRDMLGALHGVAKWIDAIAEADDKERARLLSNSETDPRVERFDVLVAEARAYATHSTITALNRTAVAFDRMNREPDPTTPEEQSKLLARMLDLMRSASEALSDELRNHLRLGAVSASSWPFTPPQRPSP